MGSAVKAGAKPGHTPGPWHWDEPSNWHGLSARVFHKNEKGDYEPIATVARSGWPRDIGRHNAALVAAAPDLLAALNAAVAVLERAGETVRGAERALQQAYAALSAATP